MNIKINFLKLIPVLLAPREFFNFDIRGKLSIIRCYKYILLFRCDANANMLTSLDLTTNVEKGDIHHFVSKCIARLKPPDRKLPQVERFTFLLNSKYFIELKKKSPKFEFNNLLVMKTEKEIIKIIEEMSYLQKFSGKILMLDVKSLKNVAL